MSRFPAGRALYAALGFVSATSAATLPAVRVEYRGPAVVGVRPGERVTVVFRLRNDSRSPVGVREQIEVPPRWQLLAAESEFILAPDTAELRLVSVLTPRNASAGRYWLSYTLFEGEEDGVRDSVLIEVAAQPGVEVTLLQGATVAPTHRDYTARFAVRNTGNVPLAIRGRATGTLAGALRLDSATWRSEPEDARVLTMVLPARVARTLRGAHDIGLAVMASGDTSIASSAHVVVDFVARSEQAPSQTLQLPASLSLRGASGGGARRGVAELVASGPVTSDGATTLDLSVRTQGLATNPLLDQDDYRATLRGARWSVRAGDQYFVQSPLTEAGQLVFGVRSEYAASRLSLNVFDQGSRWDFRRARSQGGTAAFRIGDSVAVSLNALSQRGEDAGQALSLGMAVSPRAGRRAAIEFGGGRPTAGPIARGIAWQLREVQPLFEVDVSGHETGAGYPARHGRGDERALFASVGPDRVWRLRFASTERSLDLSPYRVPYDFRSRESSIGVQAASVATIEWHRQDVLSHAADARVNEATESGRLLLFERFGALDMSSVAEVGSVEERDASIRRPFSQVSVHASLRATNLGALSFFVDKSDRRSVAGRPAERWTSAGVNASVSVGRTAVSLMALNVRDARFSRIRSALFDGRVDRWIGPSRRVSIRARTTSFGAWSAGQERYVALEFSTALRIPLATNRNAGRLVARLVDMQTGRGVPDALISLGAQRFLTDGDGRVNVAPVSPGSYALAVDQESVGGRVVDDAGAGRDVHILRGKTLFVDLGVTAGARVAGTVAVVRGSPVAPDTTPAADSAISNVLVTLRAGPRVVRQLTDSRGAFAFAGLALGRWQLTASDADLPPLHRFERDTTELDVQPGSSTKVALRVLPVRRQMRWISGGEIKTPPPPKP